MNWHVSCSDCQEPVGPPWWRNGCTCDEPLNENQSALLALLQEQWDNIEWEEV